MSMHPVAQQLQQLQAELNAAYYEREDAVEALLLAVLSGEHIFLLGPPGTGKSELTTTLVAAFTNARYFECAMSKTRSADAVLGPIDILEFRNNGHMYRKDKGFLTTADLAFIDEIGKMSPILGHDMLAILNEREKHILTLRFFKGMTQSQIAAEIGISQMHVSRLLARTLEKLRTSLADEGLDDL